MRLWTVHEPRAAANAEVRADRTIFVKDGFSWPALIIPLPWLLWQRLWLGTLVYGALVAGAAFAGAFLPIDGDARFWLALLANLYAGLEGNDLRRRKLARSGFVQSGAVLGKDRAEAELSYFAGRGVPPAAAAPAGPRQTFPSRARSDVLGLFPEPGGPR